MNIKKFLVGSAAAGLMLSSMATIALAAPPTDPGTYGTAASNAQCDTSASSGAFNFQNEVYGEGDTGLNGNSSGFGLAGGSGGGQTGINNSSVCGNPQN